MSGFTIGKVAQSAGVNVETIRFYEKKGLLQQPVATGTYREYPLSVVSRIRFIKRAKELGFTLAEIGSLLKLADEPENDRSTVRQIALMKADKLQQQIAELRKTESALRALVGRCSGKGSLEGCPIIESLGDNSFGCEEEENHG